MRYEERAHRTPRLVLAVVLLALIAAGCSGGDAADPRPGDILIDDSPSGDDEVTFYLEGEVEPSATATRERMTSAGLESGEERVLEAREGRPPSVQIDTTIGDRTGTFERTIPASVIGALGGQRVLLEMGPGGRLLGAGSKLESTPLGSTYLLGDGPAVYRFSFVFIAASLGIPIVIVVCLYLAMRRRARTLRALALEDTEKVHRIQRSILLVGIATAPLLIVGLFGTGAIAVPGILIGEFFGGTEGVGGTAGAMWMIVILVAVLLVGTAPLRSLYKEVRDIRISRAESRKRGARGLVVALVPLSLVIGLRFIEPEASWLRILMPLALFLILVTVMPLLISLSMGTSPIDPSLKQRLLSLCRDQGLRVRDVKVLKGKAVKSGNALIAGLLPGMKYILLTDYLVEKLDEEELLAVVAHEVGHGKKHHLLMKMAVPFAAIVPLAGVVGLLVALDASRETILLVSLVGTPIVTIGAVTLLHGVLGLRMEKSADDFASEVVGPRPMIGALEKLADMNTAKRDTGRFFNLITQHPNIDERIGRIRQGAATSASS